MERKKGISAVNSRPVCLKTFQIVERTEQCISWGRRQWAEGLFTPLPPQVACVAFQREGRLMLGKPSQRGPPPNRLQPHPGQAGGVREAGGKGARETARRAALWVDFELIT